MLSVDADADFYEKSFYSYLASTLIDVGKIPLGKIPNLYNNFIIVLNSLIALKITMPIRQQNRYQEDFKLFNTVN